MVGCRLVNFQCRGVLLIWIIVGQGPTVLAVGADVGCLDIFPLSMISLFFLSLSLSGRRPFIDRNSLKGPLTHNYQPTFFIIII